MGGAYVCEVCVLCAMCMRCVCAYVMPVARGESAARQETHGEGSPSCTHSALRSLGDELVKGSDLVTSAVRSQPPVGSGTWWKGCSERVSWAEGGHCSAQLELRGGLGSAQW